MLQAVFAREPSRPIRLRAWLPPGFLPPQLDVTAHEVPPVTMMVRPLGRDVWPVPAAAADRHRLVARRRVLSRLAAGDLRTCCRHGCVSLKDSGANSARPHPRRIV